MWHKATTSLNINRFSNLHLSPTKKYELIFLGTGCNQLDLYEKILATKKNCLKPCQYWLGGMTCRVYFPHLRHDFCLLHIPGYSTEVQRALHYPNNYTISIE
jgi:hypothetical protein